MRGFAASPGRRLVPAAALPGHGEAAVAPGTPRPRRAPHQPGDPALAGQAPPETLAAGIGGALRVEQRGARWQLTAGRARPGPGRAPRPRETRSGLRYEAGRLDVDRLRLDSNAGWIALRGKGRVSRARSRGRVEIGELTWSRVAEWSGQEALDLPGGLAGSIALERAGRFDHLRGRALRRAVARRAAAPRVRRQLGRGRLALTKRPCAGAQTAFQGRFDLDTERSGRLVDRGHVRGSISPRCRGCGRCPRSIAPTSRARSGSAATSGGYEGAVADARGRWRDLGLRTSTAAGRWRGGADDRRAGGPRRRGVSAAGTIRPGALDLAVTAVRHRCGAVLGATWRSFGVTRPPAGRLDGSRRG